MKAFPVALTVVALATSSIAQTDKPSLGGALRLRDHGSFYINGKTALTGGITVNQMYVQYWIPETIGVIPPVIMVHGSSHTGKTYETTPDGREGWATYFVRQQIPVYVVDLPGRARSGFDSSILNRARGESNASLIPNMARFNRIPVLAVWGDFKDAFIDRGLTQCGDLVARSIKAGGKAKLLHLPKEGFVGNSHMLMMDRNNLKVADAIIGWLRDTL